MMPRSSRWRWVWLAALTFSSTVSGMYCPEAGRFLQQDPIGYEDGLNLYEYVNCTPGISIDPMGTWGKEVHYNRTRIWARAVELTDESAAAIATADNAVDSGITAPRPNVGPIRGNEDYHFIERGVVGQSSDDPRPILHEAHFNQAKWHCTVSLMNDSPEDAAKQLGTSLHPRQDWVAHGDHGYWEVVDLKYVHNGKSDQKDLLTTYGSPSGYPDNTGLDAGGQYGRADYQVLIQKSTGAGRVSDWAYYHPGNSRISHTRRISQEALESFKSWVETNGGCKCKKYFLKGK